MGLPAGGALRRAWASERPDLVHVATEGPLGLSAVRAARSLAIPVTSSFHTNFHAYTRHYRISLFREVALGWLRHVHNLTCRTFAPTADLCRELSGLGFRNLAVLSRGVDTRQFRPERRSSALRSAWKAGPDDPVVIHVGRMAAEKNYPLLFRAYAAMRQANPSCRFVLAGEGPLKRALMRDHPDCIFAGFFSRDEIGRYYASADIYIHASLTETFGNVLTEAMASGLASVGFDYAAARIFVRDGESGLTAPCDSPERLVSAAVRLATDPALRSRLRAAAREAVEAQSWEKVICRFEADLEAVAGVAHSPADPAAVPA
jgi:glycosyltransferase involved in cell wall biosynthesis